MLFNKKKNFCDLGPICYEISTQKEILKRHIKNIMSSETFAAQKQTEELANIVSSRKSEMIKRGKGIDPVLQENKVVNLKIASGLINGVIIHPGETFSFWKLVGHATAKRGFKDGRVLRSGKLISATGGGLCNLANTINHMVLHSPLEITELHTHSDALAADIDNREPFNNGTSVCYNMIDYRFKNNTDQNFQLILRCEGDDLCGELRSEAEFPWRYELAEEDHHFKKEGEILYRNSKIYKLTFDKITNELINKELIWDNHSKVLFDYDLIPEELIRE